MKVPLEPIPTEQIMLVKTQPLPAHTGGQVRMRQGASSAPVPNGNLSSSRLESAYPWLLGASLCLSAMLCWMYVTKPVLTQASAPAVATPSEIEPPSASGDVALSAPAPVLRELVPSASTLPGDMSAEKSDAANKLAESKILASARAAGGSDVGLGWETTNLKVQHILSADPGNGSPEKIVLNVPVLYETRTMRWTPADVTKARNVMSRLMVYEQNLSSMRKEGRAILKEWNGLLANTVPAPALRADSPSLPYNYSPGGQPGELPESSSVIKVTP